MIEIVISDHQSAFIASRNILDGVIILNEALDEAKRKRIPRFFFKVDFAKAYDSVNWIFLDDMMNGLKFGVRWRK